MAHSNREMNRTGVSAAYRQELLDTFQLYDPDSTGKLSSHNLRLAMRTLGFEASQKDMDEIVNEMPSLSVHKKKKGSARRVRGTTSKAGADKNKGKTAEAAVGARRRSSRSAASTSRKGQPKYVDSEDDKEGDSEDDDNEDAYGQSEGDGEEEDDDAEEEEELYFTWQDFLTIMTPNESQHGQDEVSRIFQLFDGQDKGVIKLEDLRRVASDLGLSMTDNELREMIEEADKDGDGGVSEQDFARIMRKVGL
ncbi:hypothetical protein BGZ70_007376 [Mortierella alpina]|uniref:EF-hand domain-containing protein n=1 Tax=Mortierella alpina TaxID=64518 RepID=A0A9P6M336_MORAP|nr:hypothetical protein BGZ70_007376 [Mortierella alpina]